MTGLVKRSFALAGHRTSVALEAAFWAVLEEAAASDGATLLSLVCAVDAGRGGGVSLASALRVYCLGWARKQGLLF